MSHSWFKKKSEDANTEITADLLPVLNIMFLLIPALLLAMEFASMASISVAPPRTCADCSTERTTVREPFKLAVQIRADGFKTTVNGEPVGEDIPLREGGHDYAALTATAKQLKVAHPDDVEVTISAESEVRLQTLVHTMDALRGEDCSLGNSQRLGEAPPASCLFWQPVISS